jgi:hypothetical protein
MRKISLLLLFLLLAPAVFSNNNTLDNDNDDESNNVIDYELLEYIALEQKAEEAKSIIKQVYADIKGIDKSKPPSSEITFISEIRGDFYETMEATPYTIKYLWLSPADGSLYSGTLSKYYIRFGLIDPSTDNKMWQAFYKGVLYKTNVYFELCSKGES